MALPAIIRSPPNVPEVLANALFALVKAPLANDAAALAWLNADVADEPELAAANAALAKLPALVASVLVVLPSVKAPFAKLPTEFAFANAALAVPYAASRYGTTSKLPTMTLPVSIVPTFSVS